MSSWIRMSSAVRLTLTSFQIPRQHKPFRSVGRTYSDHIKPTDKATKKQLDSPVSEEYGYARRRSDYWTREDIQSLPPHLRPQSNETLDLILRQKVYLIQSRKGYRVNTDAHVLAYFASERYKETCNYVTKPLRVLDLGAGVGLVSILFAKAHKPDTLRMVELQPQLVRRAKSNLMLNDLEGTVMEFDVENGNLPDCLHGSFDVVLINPPFYALYNDRKPPQLREKFLAHVETTASLFDFLVAASSACDPANGEAFVALIHDKNELPRLRSAIASSGMHLHRYQEMCHISGASANRVLLELRPGTYFRRMSPVQWESRKGPKIRVPHPKIICPKTLTEAFNIMARNPLILHQDGESKKYSDHIESFLGSLPSPSLKIGRNGG